jgi:hypothetical protein
VSHRTGCGYGTAGGSMTAHGRAPIDQFGATSTITGRIASGVPIGGSHAGLRLRSVTDYGRAPPPGLGGQAAAFPALVGYLAAPARQAATM